jgi:hypothetical protein
MGLLREQIWHIGSKQKKQGHHIWSCGVFTRQRVRAEIQPTLCSLSNMLWNGALPVRKGVPFKKPVQRFHMG